MINSVTEIQNLIFDRLKGGDMLMAYAYIKKHYGCSSFAEMNLKQLKDYLQKIDEEILRNAT